jgi:hypothetical protein
MTAGPIVAGLMAAATGSYELGFTILAVLAGMGSVFFILAMPRSDPASCSPPASMSPRPSPIAPWLRAANGLPSHAFGSPG